VLATLGIGVAIDLSVSPKGEYGELAIYFPRLSLPKTSSGRERVTGSDVFVLKNR